MDPVTQGVVGATVAQTGGRAKQLGQFAVIGAVGGMAADLDILIQSSTDPLLALEYHRHFSHSFVFIPVGALICAAVLYPLLARRWQLSFWQIYLPTLLGYSTHGLLDACTTYGTQLFWPFSSYRVSFDVISIIDPLFTLPLLTLIFIAAKLRKKSFAIAALAWGLFYVGIGYVQQQRAETMGRALATGRGHEPQQLQAKPSFGNLLVWKTLYQHEQTFYVDAVRPGLLKQQVWPGQSIEALDVSRDFPWLARDSQQAQDIERFRWFSAGFIAVYPAGSDQVADIRYSLLPHQIDPLWAIEVTPEADANEHVDYITTRGDGRKALASLWSMILGKQP